MTEDRSRETTEERLQRKLGTPENRDAALKRTRSPEKRDRIIAATSSDDDEAK